MARLHLIVQSERRKRIGLAITIWLQMCTVASWFLVALGAIHSLHTYTPKISDVSASFNDVVTLLAENIRTVGLEISKSIASEVLIQQKSEMAIQESALKLYPTLCEVEGLTEDERFRALSKIPDHPMQMLIFFSLPSAVRLEWVRRFLAEH